MTKTTNEIAALSSSKPLPRLGVRDYLAVTAKATAKRGIDVAFATKAGLLRAFGLIDFPVPANSRLRRTSSHTIRHYYESGITTAMPILTAARLAGVDLDQPVKVLDFGCGVGRQLLQIARQCPNVRIFACDVAPENIKYTNRAFPAVDAYCNSFDPPLKYADNSFDLVYTVSTFSHFSLDDARLWMAELRRVTKPNGILCLTINSATSLRWYHNRKSFIEYTEAQLGKDRFFFRFDEAEWLKSKAAEQITTFGSGISFCTRPIGDMFFSRDYVEEFFESAGLKCTGIAPGIIDRMQDLVVLRKTSD